ncbi:Tub-domain-containing protein [Anaeromyces robustus]|uniref:DNA replication regulator SLD2 n=1 Tax=Anaeromyces robustus TaxID=1754192 RepID=A0A1Y1X3E1_9FUNG|nr:Tub-domain-containing protein [Anaeromyces robustus]|eukprot:ORX79834.1 Tub-domain-containing protein [Anaeromyces robustus]
MTDYINEEQQLRQLKSELKHWEHSFLKNEGHKPTKLDISNNKEIANKYRAYRKLRTKLNEKTNTNENQTVHEPKHSKNKNRIPNNNNNININNNIEKRNVNIKSKSNRNEVNNLINNKDHENINMTHEYNKLHNQIPNKLFAMSQNTNLKKKVHNYGIVHSSEINENENLSIFTNQNVMKESRMKKIEMNEKYNLKNNRDESDMLTTNSMFVSSSPKERMLDLEKKFAEKKEPEYHQDEKKTKDTSLNNLILPAPKIITFNKNEPKHELFVQVNKINKLKKDDDNDDDEIKDILLNEGKVNSNSKTRLRKKDGSLFKEGVEVKTIKKNKKKSHKKEEEEETTEISDYSESRPMLKDESKKENDIKISKREKVKKLLKKKSNVDSEEEDSEEEDESTIRANKKGKNKKNTRKYDSDNEDDEESQKERETEKENEKDDDDDNNKSPINNNKKFNFLDALPAENVSTFERIEVNHILRCRVIRKVGKINHMHPEYYLYNDDTNEFLLAARKRKNIKKMNYIITTDENSITKTSSGYVGKLTVKQDKFTLLNAENYNPNLPNKGLYESAVIFYNKNSSPREMFIALPALHLEHGSTEYSKDFLSDAKSNNTDKVIVLRNNPPRWNEATQSHCLNFSGRVTQPSIKNFQLIYDKGNSYMKYFGNSYDESQKFEPISVDNPILLQFGRCGSNNFSLDIRYPLSPLEAFSIALTTFDAFDTLY